MRFATIRTDQGTSAARLDGDVLIPLAAGDVGELLAAGGAPERAGARAVPAAEADFAPVVTLPSKIICVGLNYRSHILETGRELPEYPTLFAKFAETLMGPVTTWSYRRSASESTGRSSSVSSSAGRCTGRRRRRLRPPSRGTR